MSKNSFRLIIETPEGNKLDHSNAVSLKFKAEDGMVQILAHHMPYMTSINYSRLVVKNSDDSEEVFLCRNGIFTFDNKTNTGQIIAEYCQIQSEVTPESIQDYLALLQKQLAEGGKDLSKIQLVYLENEKFAVEQLSK